MNTNVNKSKAPQLSDDKNDGRPRLVRVRQIVDSSIFNGWGIEVQW